MARRLGGRIRDARRSFVLVLQRPSLARAELAFGATGAADWAFTIGLGVVAFEDGGASRVGLVAALRLLPSAALAPVAGTLADRWPRERVLAGSSILLAAATAASAIVLATDASLALVYLLAAVATVGLTPYRAAHSALLPSLCQTTDELVAANIMRGMLDSLSVVLGPLTAAALIGFADVAAVFAATAGAAVVAAACVTRLPYERPPQLAGQVRRGLAAEVAEGVRAARADGDVMALMALTWVQTFLRGALSVFTVVLAIDVLDTGEPGVGVLQAAMGTGAVVGSLAAAQLVGSRHLAAWHGASVAFWGLPLCLIGLVPERPTAFTMLAVIGVANAVLDVALFTMLGRLVPDEVLARVFGVFETMVAISVATGAVAAAAAIDLLDVRGALVLLGGAAPLGALLAWRRLRRIDELLGVRQDELDVLQQVPMLRALPVPMIEHLARRLTVRELAAGETVVRQGTVGTRFYVIVEGEVEVLAEGRIATMGPGRGFGEIALLRSVRRTSTVRAGPDPVTLYRIDRPDFLAAVRGYTSAASAAEDAIASWGPSDRAEGVPEGVAEDGRQPPFDLP